MNIRRTQLAVVTVIPLVAGMFGFISLSPANAEKATYQIAQAEPPNEHPPDGQHRPPRIDFAAAAAKLGVSEARLKDALPPPPAHRPNSSGKNRNQRPPRPDFKSAAQKLGVTEQRLIDALGLPPHPRGENPPPPNQ